MDNRGGEKWGWIGGILGGSVWVPAVSGVCLLHGRVLQCLIGLLLTCVMTAVVLASTPWKHPDTPYWKLMLPVYVVLFTSIAWALWPYDQEQGISWWSILLLLPLLTPFMTIGRMRWNDRVSSEER